MITAVDSCILLDVFLGDPEHGPKSADALEAALRGGSLVVCAAVWAEVTSALPDQAGAAALERLTCRFDPVTREAADLAGRMWRQYRNSGGKRVRVVADFLVGAHAACQADQLLTRDRGFFRSYFDRLIVVMP